MALLLPSFHFVFALRMRFQDVSVGVEYFGFGVKLHRMTTMTCGRMVCSFMLYACRNLEWIHCWRVSIKVDWGKVAPI